MKNILSVNNLSTRNRCHGLPASKALLIETAWSQWKPGWWRIVLPTQALLWRSDRPLGFSVIPRHPGLTACQSSMCSRIGSLNRASHPGQWNSFYTDLVGGKETVLVAVSLDISHWIQIQQMWTEHLLWVRPWQHACHASSPYPWSQP